MREYVRTSLNQISGVASALSAIGVITPLNFYSYPGKNGGEIVASDMYPPLHARWTLDFFPLVMAHNYGFWHGATEYDGALYGTLDGRKTKGSDLLWKLFLRAFEKDPGMLTGKNLRSMTLDAWRRIMSDDDGVVPLLASTERLLLTQKLGEHIARFASPLNTYGGMIRHLRDMREPARAMQEFFSDPTYGVPGFREDPLRKKATLLLLALKNRPEKFLIPEKSFVWEPIVDYHLMRIALRTGMVHIPETWREENATRVFTDAQRERAIRVATKRAMEKVVSLSGRPMEEVDVALWMARRYCPEETAPDCPSCTLKGACKKHTELFQPVFRTITY